MYTASYSLHDGDDELKEGETPTNDRQKLRVDWARFGRCFKYQPYAAIKNYFGTEVRLWCVKEINKEDKWMEEYINEWMEEWMNE